MPRGRILLKKISQSKKLSLLKTDGARLLYTWLIPYLDINGCFSGDPAVILGQIMPRLGKNIKDITKYLADIETVGLIITYEANGDVFLHLPDFKEKQPKLNPNKEAVSDIPLPTPEQLQSYSRVTPELLQHKLSIKDKGKDKDKEEPKNVYAEFVKLTEDEHNKLVSKYNKLTTQRIIEFLSNYKGSNGKKYKSDYHAILTWAGDKVIGDMGGVPATAQPRASPKQPCALCHQLNEKEFLDTHDTLGEICRTCWQKQG